MLTSLSSLAVAAYLVVANLSAAGEIRFIPFGTLQACEQARQQILSIRGTESQRAYVCVKAK